MIYHLFYWLRDESGFFNVFRYQTFRAMAAFILSISLVLFLQPRFIRWFREKQLGQPIRDDGPQTHFSKKGTPTMGGLVVVLAVVVSTILLCDLTNLYVWAVVGITLCYAGLGFLDDYRKIVQKNPKGVSARLKLRWQLGGAAFFILMLFFFAEGFHSDLGVPFYKNLEIQLGYFFIPFAVLVIVGTSNAVNLTDGLDGLVIGPVMTVAFAYGIFAYVGGNLKIAEYLQIGYVSGAGELAIFCAAMIGGGLGFLWFNSFPAQVFMGDVGALALGGAIGMLAVITKQELLLVLAGGIFVVEAVSVILQVGSFKMTGKRIFKMAPIHHHFELKGMSEPKIIVRAWIISIVLAVLSLATLKLR